MQLRKAIALQFSIERNEPLEALIAAASDGNHSELDKHIHLFSEHANKFVELSLLAASISNNTDGVQLVEMASHRLKNLLPKVIHAAQILCSFSQSDDARQNMDIYRQAWMQELKLLILAIDDIMSINDFLAVSERQILHDINECIHALNSLNATQFYHAATRVITRTVRVCDAVSSEMSNYERCDFTSRVVDSVKIIKETIVSEFAHAAEYAKHALTSRPVDELNQNEFIDASRSIYDSVRELRNALLLVPQENDDSDNMDDEEITQTDDGDRLG